MTKSNCEFPLFSIGNKVNNVSSFFPALIEKTDNNLQGQNNLSFVFITNTWVSSKFLNLDNQRKFYWNKSFHFIITTIIFKILVR